MSFSAPDLVGRMIRSAKARMTPLASEWEATFTIERAVRVGVPYVEIVRYAHEHDVDLIVMSTHGRGAVGHMLFGSLAERVVRRAPCPVLTVRQPGSHAGFSGTKGDQAMRLGGRQSRAIHTTVTRPGVLAPLAVDQAAARCSWRPRERRALSRAGFADRHKHAQSDKPPCEDVAQGQSPAHQTGLHGWGPRFAPEPQGPVRSDEVCSGTARARRGCGAGLRHGRGRASAGASTPTLAES